MAVVCRYSVLEQLLYSNNQPGQCLKSHLVTLCTLKKAMFMGLGLSWNREKKQNLKLKNYSNKHITVFNVFKLQ